MIRLRRRGVEAHDDWQSTVDAALPDATEFWRLAKAFERLAEQGAMRKGGFSAYAPHTLPINGDGKREFPAVWRDDEELRQKIARMSRGFCSYCQSPASPSHPGKEGEKKPPGQIEHFRPKSRFPAQAYEWENYFLSCAGCNNAKHDKWPAAGYVRPDEGRPGSRFVFAKNGDIEGRQGDEQARNTVEDCDLKRHWLAEHRKIAIESHLGFVRRLLGFSGIRLEELLVEKPVAYSEAINQNVRRVWAGRAGKKKRA